MSRTVASLTHPYPNRRLTLLGIAYPRDIWQACDQIHLGARRDSPYSFAALPMKAASWRFQSPKLNAQLEIDGSVALIRMVCVINQVDDDKHRPFIWVTPFYQNDANRSQNLLVDRFVFKAYEDDDCQDHPVPLTIVHTNFVRDENDDPSMAESLKIYDSTSMDLNDKSILLPLSILQKNDLVVATCTFHLQANPDVGAARFYLCAHEIQLVYVSTDVE